MLGSSSHVLLGPLVALAALGLIVLICRWVFSTTERDERTARRLEQAVVGPALRRLRRRAAMVGREDPAADQDDQAEGGQREERVQVGVARRQHAPSVLPSRPSRDRGSARLPAIDAGS